MDPWVTDPHGVAFRESTEEDWDDLVGLAPVPASDPIRSPEDFDGWDADRLDPKTLEQARRELAARAEDPSAPDDDPTAYDGLGPLELAKVRGAGAPQAAGSIRLTWLADACRSSGLPVVLVAGWEGRGHGGFRAVELVIGHHTATPERATGDYPSLRVVRDGRAGLAGPLCNLGLGRNGTVYVIAAGVGWHAGASRFLGFTDLNDESIGIEAEDSGDGQWSDQQMDAYPRLVAALLRYMNRGAERYASHRTIAVPAGRKPDPAGLSDQWMRDHVTRILAGGLRPTQGTSHVVVAGDTLYSLARRYGASVAQLRGWNGLGSDTLKIGQSLQVAATPAPAPPPTPPPVGQRVLRVADPLMVGEDVKAIQRVLRAWYGLPWSWVDGRFGNGTADYVKRAQRGTPPAPVLDPDGIVGPRTRAKLGL